MPTSASPCLHLASSRRPSPTRRVLNIAPVGEDQFTDAIELSVPLMLIDAGDGPRWYPRVLSSEQADLLCDVTREGGRTEIYRLDLPVLLPPAFLVDDAVYHDLDDATCLPVRVQIETSPIAPSPESIPDCFWPPRMQRQRAEGTAPLAENADQPATADETEPSPPRPGLFDACPKWNVIAQRQHEEGLPAPGQDVGEIVFTTIHDWDTAQQWLDDNPLAGYRVEIVNDDPSTWPFPAERTTETVCDRYDEHLERLLDAARLGRGDNASPADRLAFELVQLLLTAEGTAEIDTDLLLGAEVLAYVYQENRGLMLRHAGRAMR